MRILKVWIPIAFLATVLAGTVYIAVQQEMRQSANDLQIQMAYDTVSALSAGIPVSNFDSKNKTDLSAIYNLSPFIIIYDKDGNPVASQSTLLGKVPRLPAGVLNYVRKYTEDRITWEPNILPFKPPQPLRIASVIVGQYDPNIKGYAHFVLAGRSLVEVEKRESMLTLQVGLGWAVATFGSLVLIVILEIIFPNKKK